MKDFDIKAAKEGHPVCTRNGCPVRILAYDRRDDEGFCIVGLVTADNSPSEVVGWWRKDGSCSTELCKHPNDLMLDTPSVSGYINVYKFDDGDNSIYHVGNNKTIYRTKALAMSNIDDKLDYIDTIEIEWGEDLQK